MTVAEIIMWGTKIGTVVFDRETGLGSFEYDPAFLSSGIEVSPLAMPLSRRVYAFPELARQSFHGLPGLLADSLPDKFGNAIIDAWLQSQGRSPSSFDPVERLCYTGSRGMGALEYVPARGPSPLESESIEIDRLVQLASDILRSREDMHIVAGGNAMQELIRVGTSAGGARAKAVIAWNEQTGDIRSGQIDAGKGYEYWLIKFDGVSKNGDKEGDDAPQYTKIEYAYYLMAQNAGISMSECRLYEENGRYHFMTRRFDRDLSTGAKLHMQSLSNTEISQFYRRMVFNVLARNQDDHVKNVSFLMDKRGRWSLSPAYDVTYAYNPHGMWTGTHQMTVNGKRDAITMQDLLSTARNMGVKNAEAERIISEVRESQAGWLQFAEETDLQESTAMKIQEAFITV